MERLLTVTEAAEMLRLAPGTIYHLISRHAVPCVRVEQAMCSISPVGIGTLDSQPFKKTSAMMQPGRKIRGKD